ncbi:MAG: hypothetical protein J6W74_02410 [Bacteroidales bacterium]|nr:hypothetical protein [Bacteroidales bacterium]
MKSIIKKGYYTPALRVIGLATEIQFLATTQLDDYPDNPIFGAPKNGGIDDFDL